MPITVQWDNPEKTRLYYEYIGKWTWEDQEAMEVTAHELAASVDYPVDVIADFSKAPLLPANALTRFKSSWTGSPMKVGAIAVITNSSLVERLASIFQRINSNYTDKFKVVRSRDEAYAFIVKSTQYVK